MIENKYGLLPTRPTQADWEVGSSPIDFELINPEGNWTNWLPAVEYQNRWGYDRMACVTYSYLNCLETLYYFKTGKPKNFSDRWLAKLSGTNRNGNYLSSVADTARNLGLVDEYVWPDTEGGWNEYYKEIPQDIINKGKDFLKDWSLYREWVYGADDMYLALKATPLQVTVAYASGNGILNPSGIHNHAVMVYNAKKDEYWEVFDHYTQSEKKYAWNYQFGAILKPSLLTKKTMLTIQNNTLVQLVQGAGNFGLYLDNKIIVDDLAKIMAVWQVRNQGDTRGKVRALTLEQWEMFDKVNLEEFSKLNKYEQ
jgi:hypothetical protein